MSASRAWVFVGAAVAILPSVSSSESPSQDAQSQQYVVDSTGRSSVVTDGIGSCVHTGFWTAGNAIDSCPGDTTKSSAAAPAATQAQTAAESPAPPPAVPPPAPTAAAVPAPTPAPVATEEPPPPVVVAPVPERRDPAAGAALRLVSARARVSEGGRAVRPADSRRVAGLDSCSAGDQRSHGHTSRRAPPVRPPDRWSTWPPPLLPAR